MARNLANKATVSAPEPRRAPQRLEVESNVRTHSIPTTIVDIQDSLSDLDNRMSELSARLVPVLSPPFPLEELPSGDAPCGLASELRDINRRIRSHFFLVNSLIERLEI